MLCPNYKCHCVISNKQSVYALVSIIQNRTHGFRFKISLHSPTNFMITMDLVNIHSSDGINLKKRMSHWWCSTYNVPHYIPHDICHVRSTVLCPYSPVSTKFIQAWHYEMTHILWLYEYTVRCWMLKFWYSCDSKMLKINWCVCDYIIIFLMKDKTRDTVSMEIPYDDVIKWKHFSRRWHFVRGIHRKGGALMLSLICAWIKGWVNNGEAGDLRRHRAQYDVILMPKICEDKWQPSA